MNSRIFNHRPAIDAHCRRFGVQRLFLFGSAASSDPDGSPGFEAGRSDFDFYVEFGPPPTGSRADQYFGLLFALQETLGTKVDLVEVGAIQNPIVLASVERTKVPVYAAA
ncbi:MAG: nucleotidyltransferase family protein [Phycisphaerales bacterium]